MMDKAQLYQALVFVVVVLSFDLLERLRPGQTVHRSQSLILNFTALFIVIVGGEMWKALLLKGVNVIKPAGSVFLGGIHSLPGAVRILLGIILADLSLYWVHRAMHRRAVLWRTHIFHHSIEELWWLSGSRTSLLHLLLFAIPQVSFAYYLLNLAPSEAGVAFSIGVFVNVWIHTNLWVDLGFLEKILITPNFHRVHHGSKGLSAKNLGFLFTFWDIIFGTYADPKKVGKDFDLGFVSIRERLLRMIIGF